MNKVELKSNQIRMKVVLRLFQNEFNTALIQISLDIITSFCTRYSRETYKHYMRKESEKVDFIFETIFSIYLVFSSLITIFQEVGK